jgi:hypothetical protein
MKRNIYIDNMHLDEALRLWERKPHGARANIC